MEEKQGRSGEEQRKARKGRREGGMEERKGKREGRKEVKESTQYSEMTKCLQGQ